MSPREGMPGIHISSVARAQPDSELRHLSYTDLDSNPSSPNYMTIGDLFNLSDLRFQICKLGHKN